MNECYIMLVFDWDLEMVQVMVVKMGGMVESVIYDVVIVLEICDEELVDQVCRCDKVVDELEVQINEEVVCLIVLCVFIVIDLCIVLIVIKILGIFEWVGDYVKNIVKCSYVLVYMFVINGLGIVLCCMMMIVEGMMKDVLDVYIQCDLVLVIDVCNCDLEVDQMYNVLFCEFLIYMMEDLCNIIVCMYLYFIVKNIECVGDYVIGIVEQVIYLVIGQLFDEFCFKSDVIICVMLNEGED